MLVLFIIFSLINLLVLIYLYREGFVVRSNMRKKYQKRFVAMLLVLAGSAVSAGIHLPLACLIAGIPACLTILFFAAMAIGLAFHKGPWN